MADTKVKVQTIMSDDAPLAISSKDFDLAAVKRQFSTGSVGYYGNGKLVIVGQMYQASLTLTLIGSKPE